MKRHTKRHIREDLKVVYTGADSFEAVQKLGRIEDFEEEIGYSVEEFLWVIKDKLKEWDEIKKEYQRDFKDRDKLKAIYEE